MSEIQDYAAAASSAPRAEGPTLGMLLKKAREVRGLTVGDVVQTLKFSAKQIEALEANDMAALPGSVFVRGIVRSYARFLKLDPEPLLALLAADAPVALPDVRPPDNMGNAMPKNGLRQIPPLVAFAVLLLIASATMVGWHYFGSKPTVAGKSVESSMEPAANPAAAPPAVAALTSAAATDELPPAAAGASSETAAPLPADARQLAFRFRGKSWVEVKDASQQVILTGQYVDGNHEQVSGKPPFQLVIGNAAQVELVYGDRAIDLKPYTRAEVARLSLD